MDIPQYKLASLEMTPNDLALARSACLKAMGAIIPHHCGNHKECDVSYCKYLQFDNISTILFHGLITKFLNGIRKLKDLHNG